MSVVDHRPALSLRAVRETSQPGYVVVAAVSAVIAAGIHFALVPEHLREATLIGTFFAAVAAGQLALAAALRRRLPVAALVSAIVAHVGLIALYVASRSVGLPFVPAHHAVQHLPVARGVGNGIPIYPGARTEPVGVLDIVCLVTELVLIAALAGLLPARVRDRVTGTMVTLGLLGLVAVAGRVVVAMT
ncbi:MAG: hypothetical protein ABI873_16955 [Marmoricola sp.]